MEGLRAISRDTSGYYVSFGLKEANLIREYKNLQNELSNNEVELKRIEQELAAGRAGRGRVGAVFGMANAVAFSRLKGAVEDNISH